jgi:hypothetical protein
LSQVPVYTIAFLREVSATFQEAALSRQL